MKAKSSRLDILVARYMPLFTTSTDDPREAIALTRNGFRSAQKHCSAFAIKRRSQRSEYQQSSEQG